LAIGGVIASISRAITSNPIVVDYGSTLVVSGSGVASAAWHELSENFKK
jgi:hypothetical protein